MSKGSASSSPAECIKTIRSGYTLGVKGSNPNGFTCDVVKDGWKLSLSTSPSRTSGSAGLGSGCFLREHLTIFPDQFHQGLEDLCQNCQTGASMQPALTLLLHLALYVHDAKVYLTNIPLLVSPYYYYLACSSAVKFHTVDSSLRCGGVRRSKALQRNPAL